MVGPIDAVPGRADALEALERETWDLVVVGGGIVGAGAALDAAARGLRTVLLEQDDIAAGTSSRSSRLIHGGLRYLEDLRLHLVREALVERGRLLRLAPHLVRLRPFLFPIFGLPLVHRTFYGSGLVLYDLLGASRDGGRARHLSAGAVSRLVPAIRRQGLRGGITYHDGVEDDARYALAVARTATARGATVVTRIRATGLERGVGKTVAGVSARDLIGERDLALRARAVIDATGVWAARPDAPLGGSAVPIVPSRGSHLVVPRERLPLGMGMTLRIPGRVLFIVPAPGAWIIGTTDEPDSGPPERPAPTATEVGHILGMVNDVLDVGLSREDVVGAYAGLRPLVGVPGGDTVRVSREHKVHREPSGVVRVSGGKYTTYRIMARDAVDVALEGRSRRPPSTTEDTALIGAAPRARLEALATELAAGGDLSPGLADLLVERHGTEATAVLDLARSLGRARPLRDDVPHLEAEVTWAVRHELALTVDDVLARRMRLSMRLRDQGASLAPRVAALMGEELGWDGPRQAAEVRRYVEAAAREYGVPSEAPRQGVG